MTTRTLPAAAQARLERIRAEAELVFIPASTALPEPFDGGDSGVVFLQLPSPDPATEVFVVTMAEATIAIVCDVATSEHWPVEALRSETDARLEQLIDQAYAQKHSHIGVTLERFRTERYQTFRSLPWWVSYLDTVREYSNRLAERPAWALHLQQLRDESGWTVEALAEAIESDGSNVADHLWGRVKPNAKTRRLYEKVFSQRLRREVTLDV